MPKLNQVRTVKNCKSYGIHIIIIFLVYARSVLHIFLMLFIFTLIEINWERKRFIFLKRIVNICGFIYLHTLRLDWYGKKVIIGIMWMVTNFWNEYEIGKSDIGGKVCEMEKKYSDYYIFVVFRIFYLKIWLMMLFFFISIYSEVLGNYLISWFIRWGELIQFRKLKHFYCHEKLWFN